MEREDHQARAEALDARVDFHFLDVPPDELLRRLAVGPQQGDPADIPITAEQLAGIRAAVPAPRQDELARWRS